ncbi:MAG: hypothetical protein ABI615_07020, partial [Chthoniobacterales bacterium]
TDKLVNGRHVKISVKFFPLKPRDKKTTRGGSFFSPSLCGNGQPSESATPSKRKNKIFSIF